MLVPDFKPNPDEVRNYEFVGRKELDDFLAERLVQGELQTPWF